MFFGSKHGSGKSNVQLENQYKQLELQNMTLSDQLENFKMISFKYQDQYNKLAKKINNFCYMLLDSQYAKDQLGGSSTIKDMDIFQLIDFSEGQYRQNFAKERDLLISLSNQLRQKDLEIEGLKAEISRYMLKEKQLKRLEENQANQPVEEEEDRPVEKAEAIKTAPEIKPFAAEERKPDQNTNKPNGIMRMAVIEEDDDIVVMPTKPMQKTNNTPSRIPGKTTPAADIEPAKNNKTIGKLIMDTVKADDKKKAGTEDKEATMASMLTNPLTSVSKAATLTPAAQTTIIEEDDDKPDETVEKIKAKIETMNEQQKENDIMVHVINLNDTINKMTDVMWVIVEAIGSEGFSENKDIKQAVINRGMTESAFNTAIKQLERANIVDLDRINTGWRWFYAYELSDLGSRIYLEKYKKSAVECEKQILKKEHTTALHGYCIKDSASILKVNFGYDEAITDRKANSMKLYNSQTYIPDVVAKKKEGAIVDYIEVELGHHTQKDFNAKCDKMRMVAKDLFFVVPDADTMNKTLVKQIGQWVLEKGGKDKLKGTTVYLTTLTKLSEGKWETTYPF